MTKFSLRTESMLSNGYLYPILQDLRGKSKLISTRYKLCIKLRTQQVGGCSQYRGKKTSFFATHFSFCHSFLVPAIRPYLTSGLEGG